MNERIAIITGANRGIGFEICKGLAKLGFEVILAARDEIKGEEAAETLKRGGLNVVFEQLEVGEEESTNNFSERMGSRYGRVDVLVNNAGVLLNSKGIENASIDEVRKTFDTNFFGPLMLIQALLPMLKKSADGRVVNISSGMGAFNEMGGGHLAYRTSKTALNSLTKVVSNDLAGTRIKINSMCPGWVQSDMGGKNAPRSLQQGADTAIWLATDAHTGTGMFYRDRREIRW